MKEIFVDVDGELNIANAYKNKLIISRTEDGYFVESDNEKKVHILRCLLTVRHSLIMMFLFLVAKQI